MVFEPNFVTQMQFNIFLPFFTAKLPNSEGLNHKKDNFIHKKTQILTIYIFLSSFGALATYHLQQMQLQVVNKQFSHKKSVKIHQF